ncbi:MAG: formate dehydrogenase accessory sulfurtransferase FdhD [Ferruginibacter sp.]
MKTSQQQEVIIQKISGNNSLEAADQVAIEEPLEIRIAYGTADGRMEKNISVTMRTPGNDEELAAGFLFTEAIINDHASIKDIKHVAADDNRILVTLKENILPALNKTDRNFYSTSSCGVCGKASIDAIHTNPVYQNKKDNISIGSELLYGLQDKLRKQQEIFQNTGGIHASAIFSLDAKFIMLREDVGRHNALDKLIGAALLKGSLPLNNCILLLSGRASFELIQKAAMAGIKIVAAVGAPSSLAIEMAEESGITLIGFLRDRRFNLYSGFQRLQS